MAKRPPSPSSKESQTTAAAKRLCLRSSSREEGEDGGGGGATADRISALPDAVLQRILSLLPISAAARTSVLSRRWRLLWTAVPSLELHHHHPYPLVADSSSYYHRFVLSMLSALLRRSSSAGVRSLRFLADHPRFAAAGSSSSSCCAADEIAAFALRSGAQELSLDFRISSRNSITDITECLEVKEVGHTYNYFFLHRLPLSLLKLSPSLRVVRLKDCRIRVPSAALAAPPGLLAPQLETLWLTRVYPEGGGDGRIQPLLDRLIGGCPKLESLGLEGYPMGSQRNAVEFHVPRSEDLRLSCRQLIHLTVRCCHSFRSLQVDAPRLESLQYVGEVVPPGCRFFVLVASPGLVRAEVVFCYCTDRNRSGAEERERNGMLQKLSHVQSLSIQSRTPMDYLVSKKVGDKTSPIYRQLRTLELQGNFPSFYSAHDASISYILSFLGEMPILEHLTLGLSSKICPIEINENHSWDEENEVPELEGVTVNCLQHSLKTIKITELYKIEIHISLVKYLLRNAFKLEEMWVRSRPALYADHLRIQQELLKLRANSSTKITLI